MNWNRLPEVYPCNDVPTACGCDDPKDMCNYPYCWPVGWIADPSIQNKTANIGDTYKRLIYRGESPVLADTIFQYFKSVKNLNKVIPIINVRCSVRISGVEVVEMCGVYQIEITGELE